MNLIGQPSDCLLDLSEGTFILESTIWIVFRQAANSFFVFQCERFSLAGALNGGVQQRSSL